MPNEKPKMRNATTQLVSTGCVQIVSMGYSPAIRLARARPRPLASGGEELRISIFGAERHLLW